MKRFKSVARTIVDEYEGDYSEMLEVAANSMDSYEKDRDEASEIEYHSYRFRDGSSLVEERSIEHEHPDIQVYDGTDINNFKNWIDEEVPYLWPLFDFSKEELIEGVLEEYFENQSRGNQIMTRFVAGIWCNENKFNFDFTDAATHLNEDQKNVVTNWLKNPIRP